GGKQAAEELIASRRRAFPGFQRHETSLSFSMTSCTVDFPPSVVQGDHELAKDYLASMIEPDRMKQKTSFIANLLHNRALIVSLLILAAATIVVLPIFLSGFPRGSDIGFHLRWNTWFAEELRQGNLYPRWLSAANRGYGSPVTLYYPPLQFY